MGDQARPAVIGQVVSTAAELDALPLGTIIMSVADDFPRLCDPRSGGVNFWLEPGSTREISSADLVAHVLSLGLPAGFVVLHLPKS